MRIAVRSRYTNLHGGYEEGAAFDGRPAFRKATGGAWIFHAHSPGSAGGRWHFGPELPGARSGSAAAFFASLTDAPTPDGAEWPADSLERVWQPAADPAASRAADAALFVDKSFPPHRRSIGEVPALAGKREPEWIPVRRLRAGTWSLFEGGVSANDLLQGAIGNCWLVAAMASLAEFPQSVEALFCDKDVTANGRYEIRLYDARKMGHVKLAIDEFIPCHPREWWDEEGMPLFARPNGNEAWVLLLEKAFAKMIGSYRELNGGNCCTAFRAFTGEQNVFVWARGEGELARVDGEWKRMKLADGETYFEFTPGLEDRRDSDGLWGEVCMYAKRSFLVACSMRAVHGQEHIRVDGLVEAHAYSLLHALDVDGHKLLFLRNPWGNDKKWNGRWSDGDDAWAKNPGVRTRLRPQFQDDGTFWMAWVDFQATFDFVYVCPRLMRSKEAAAEHERRATRGEVPLAPCPPRHPRRRVAEALPERLPRLAAGALVELVGLGPDLDGHLAEVVGWDESAGTYELREAPPKYWTCPVCGEINRRSREACNVCAGARSVLAPESLARYRARPECVALPPGTEVEVDGLADFPELNGQAGRVVAFDRRAGRYHVELPDGRVRAIRPPHIIARRAPTEEADFARWAAPAPEPSHVDEPEPPDEVPCGSDEELRRLAEDLDEGLALKRDVELPGGAHLRRGQQLVREGELGGRSVEQLRRGGIISGVRLRLRFTRHSPLLLRLGPAGAYAEAVLRLDAAFAELLLAELGRQRLSPGRFAFFALAQPGWAGPVIEELKSKPRRPKAWAGWVCPECGHINDGGTDYCTSCEPDG